MVRRLPPSPATTTCCEAVTLKNLSALRSAVEHRLSSPDIHQDFEAFLLALHWTDITATLEAPPLMEELPDLGDRFRGALGRRLEQMGEVGAEAWHLCFGPPFGAGREEACRPFALKAERIGQQIVWRVRLFGFADLWAEEIMEAMRLATAGGLALRQSGRHRVPVRITTLERTAHWWCLGKPLGDVNLVTTRTPLVIRTSQSVNGTLRGFKASAVRRLLAVARWCDARPARGDSELICDACWHFDDVSLAPVGWVRHSTNHPLGRSHAGFEGRFRLTGVNAKGALIIRSAELFHAGGGATSGYGRIHVVAV